MLCYYSYYYFSSSCCNEEVIRLMVKVGRNKNMLSIP